MGGQRVFRYATSVLVMAACVIVLMHNWAAQANPPGISDGLHKVFQFNLIGHPGEYNGDCGQGHRIFVERDAHHAHILIKDTDDGWFIAECDATGNNSAELHTDEAAIYDMYVRMLGNAGETLDICADTVEDHDTGEHLCLLGTLNLTTGNGQKKFTVVPDEMFDAEFEDLIWSVETSSGFKLAQFRVYKVGE